jgi:hypothetical protein
MTQILVTKPGTLTAGDRRKLRAAGVVTVEAEDPDEVRLISPEAPTMKGGDLAFAAINALSSSGNAYDLRAQFVKVLSGLLADQRDATGEGR